MRFTKMNGAGNDFILLDAIAEPFDESAAPALARALCDRRRSVGADGLMLVTRAEGDADYRMRFYNSDGSLGEMCGNGARCICRYGYARGYAGPVQRVETTAGLVTGWRITEEQYRIRLNTPSVVELEKQLDADGRTYRCSYIELGSPGIPHLALEVPAPTTVLICWDAVCQVPSIAPATSPDAYTGTQNKTTSTNTMHITAEIFFVLIYFSFLLRLCEFQPHSLLSFKKRSQFDNIRMFLKL